MLSAKQQLVYNTLYFITLEAIDGDKKNIYEAAVWNVPWVKSRLLQDFKLIGDSPLPVAQRARYVLFQMGNVSKLAN